jgi:iron complex outermembrane recepter protein
MKRFLSPLSTSLSALAFMQCTAAAYAAPAIAKEAETTEALALASTTAAAETADAADDADLQNTDGLTEIVVTATKRETNLQDTPISISVMSSEDLKKRQVQSLLDLADGGIPSLRVATFESRQSALTVGMRGIVPGDANQPAREQGVGVYIDGVYLGRQHGLNSGFLDIERIEVLKGPQGTLFGRNTEGGAVNLVNRAPTGEFGGRATAGLGNYGSYNGGLHIDLPEFAGVSIKVDGGIQHLEATTKNPLSGQFGWNYFHRYGGRIAARVKAIDNIVADFSIDAGRDENTAFLSQLINYNPNNRPVATLAQIVANNNRIPSGFIAPLPAILKVQPDRVSVADIGVPQQPSIGKSFGATSNIKWSVSDDIEVRAITAWRTVSDDQFDNSGGANRTPVFTPNGTFSRYSIAKLDQRQFSQELQIVGKAPDFDYVIGAYYFNERANDEARTPNTNRFNADGTGFSIVDPATYPLATTARASIAFAKSYAFYGQGTYSPSAFDQLHVTLGGRVTRDDKNGRLFTVNGAPTTFTFTQRNDRFDPLATVAFDVSEDLNVYAKYATGYRAGGASSRSLNYRSFGPESVQSYEIGAKTEFLDRKVRLNLAAYIMDRKNSQVDFNFFIPQTNGTVRNTLETVNALGTTKIKGIEADLTVRPVDGLSLGLSYAYTDIKVPPAQNTVQEQLNASLTPPITTPVFQDVFTVYSPKHAVSGSIDYALPLGDAGSQFKLHLDANYSSPAFTFDNENVLNEKSFIVNGCLSIADIPMSDNGQKLVLSAWARNLLNESHIYRRSNANRSSLGDYANFNAPRTFGFEATVAF